MSPTITARGLYIRVASGCEWIFATRIRSAHFVYHCHLLEHEDGGMMGLIRVDPAESAQNAATNAHNAQPKKHRRASGWRPLIRISYDGPSPQDDNRSLPFGIRSFLWCWHLAGVPGAIPTT